jgi:DNA-damage-inducible protein D
MASDDTTERQSIYPAEVADVLAFFPMNPEKPEVRKEWINGRWYYAIIDILDHLDIAEKGASKYWSQLQEQTKAEGFIEAKKMILQIVIPSPTDGKRRKTDFADRRTLFRLFQSIKNPKLEPFRQFLAKTGDEKIAEMEQQSVTVPETEFLTMVQEFISQGYGPDHAVARATDIIVRNEWTDEVSYRGATTRRDYIELTAILHRGAFGLTPGRHKEYKGISARESLQPHLTIEELGLSTFTKTIHVGLSRRRNTQGMPGLRNDAFEAGKAGGEARKIAEQALGGPLVSPENYLHLKAPKSKNRLPKPLAGGEESSVTDLAPQDQQPKKGRRKKQALQSPNQRKDQQHTNSEIPEQKPLF